MRKDIQAKTNQKKADTVDLKIKTLIKRKLI